MWPPAALAAGPRPWQAVAHIAGYTGRGSRTLRALWSSPSDPPSPARCGTESLGACVASADDQPVPGKALAEPARQAHLAGLERLHAR